MRSRLSLKKKKHVTNYTVSWLLVSPAHVVLATIACCPWVKTFDKGGIGGTVDSESALRFARTILLRLRALAHRPEITMLDRLAVHNKLTSGFQAPLRLESGDGSGAPVRNRRAPVGVRATENAVKKAGFKSPLKAVKQGKSRSYRCVHYTLRSMGLS
ncbi:hypothetical protein PoB_004237300 [Plakobranchus ocellatus]|uniref:Uncharacterized protein n=1 Tax=Plakobranchus ocellatus TaxID=259542 RepID=A0AAV4BAM5_9GAST|nr:hypothetical protein PoB_004237300 [Plakobranchus ocellatus]